MTFPLDDEPDVSLVAWTTTPWTLPSNLALCVHPDKNYAKIKGGQYSVLCFSLLYVIGKLLDGSVPFV